MIYNHQKIFFYLYFIVLLILTLLSSSSSNIVNAQLVLPQGEIDSAVWLIQQYRVNVGIDQNSICNSTAFKCVNLTSGYHITEIDIYVFSQPQPAVQIDPTFQLYFPEAIRIFINGNYPSVATINILTKIRNLPKLVHFQLNSDSTAASFPPDFADSLPSLIKFVSSGCPFPNLGNFFNNSGIQDIYVSGFLKHLSIDSTLNLTKLTRIELFLSLTVEETYIFTKESFPKLIDINFYSYGAKVNLNFFNSPEVVLLNGVSYDVNFSDNSSTTVRTFGMGGVSTVSPSLVSFPNLYTLTLENYSYPTLPFAQYPTSMRYLSLREDHLASFPIYPLGNLTSLTLQNSNLVGPIPWNLLTPPNIFSLDVSMSKNITGTVPESFCPYKLAIQYSGISAVPDCYWCYAKNYLIFSTTLSPPLNFACTITFENRSIITSQGYGTLRGNNIGFGHSGTGYSLNPILPQKELKIYVGNQVYGKPSNVTIVLDPFYPEYSFNITYLETFLNLHSFSVTQLPLGVYQLKLGFYQDVSTTTSFSHTIMVNETFPCVFDSYEVTSILCNLTSVKIDTFTSLNVSVSNTYMNVSKVGSMGQMYPQLLFYKPPPTPYILIGSTLQFGGFFGNQNKVATVYLDGNSSICIFKNSSLSIIECEIVANFKGGSINVTISVDGFLSYPLKIILNTAQDKCQADTNNCNNHGTCNIDGVCVCDKGYSDAGCLTGIYLL